MTTTNILYYVVLPMLTFSLLLVFVRFVKGPNISDRIVALDLMITIGIGIMTIYAIVTHQASFLDISMIFALIAFLGTIAFSYYIEKRNRND